MNRLVGTAGWAIPRRWAALAPADSKGLARYARVLNAVEINSSFYRAHARDTYARWAQAVPEGFQFSVKVPKAVTHEAKLLNTEDALRQFLDQAGRSHSASPSSLFPPGWFLTTRARAPRLKTRCACVICWQFLPGMTTRELAKTAML